MIGLKLNKDSRPKFTTKAIVSAVVVALLVGITAVSFTNGGRVDSIESKGVTQPFYAFGKHMNNIVSETGNFFGDIANFRNNSKRVKELEKENEKLSQEIINLKSDESKHESLERLKKSLNYVSGNQRNSLISASIIGKNEGVWYQSFIIDAGAGSGIRKNSIVINGQGVVGIVYSVNNNYCKAISLVDSKASVSFKVADNEDFKGVITTSSTVGNSSFTDTNKLLHGYLFDSNSKIKKGDLIVTSGLGLYPENIPIGKVTEVTYEKNKAMKLIKVRPNVDFKKLDEVSIIPPRKTE